ncbi:hypothetical protein INR49_015367 [Caranx melampygus]|nr:hypothetical protein INR49_015367 [Caranx melampygus]
MDFIFKWLILLWSSGLQTEAKRNSSEPVAIRLIGGANRCVGGLEMKHKNVWWPVDDHSFRWNLRTSATVCRELDCGSVVSARLSDSSIKSVWKVDTLSVQSDSAPTEHVLAQPLHSFTSVEITCSESVRLVDGMTLCSGRVKIRADQSWSTVCEGDFDWQDAVVVCRELGCGAPLQLQRALYENTQAPEWRKEFWCNENESTLLDCEMHESARNTCSPVHLTCSEPNNIRLVEGGSRCAGRLELKFQGEWKPVDGKEELQKSAALVCRRLKCGSVVSIQTESSAIKYAWGIIASRAQNRSTLREYVSVTPCYSSNNLKVICSDLLYQPIISISPPISRVDASSVFTISCSIKPQYPGGFFQLIVFTSSSTHTYTLEAVNHTAHFLFPAVHNSHDGNYSCVYHINAFSHNFSSQSQPLSLSIPVVLIIRLGLIFTVALFLSAIYFYNKATGGQKSGGQEKIGFDCCHLSASRAEGGLNDAAGIQETHV